MKTINKESINNLITNGRQLIKKKKIKLNKVISKFTTQSKSIAKEIKRRKRDISLTRLVEKIQDSFERKVINHETEEVLLRQSSTWSRGITWTLLSGTFLGIGWLAIAQTEEIIISQGKLEPIRKSIDVQVPQGGVISEILIKEGQIVNKEDILIKLDTDKFDSKVKNIKEILKLNQQLLLEFNQLAKEGAISKIQAMQQKIKVSDLETQLLSHEIDLKYQIIRAPATGKVFNLLPSGKGYVARTTEPLFQIIPLDNLHANIEIESRKIGFVSVGKKVDISIDSYPATDFGVIKGIISAIGSDALEPNMQLNKGYRFPAKVKLDTQRLRLKNGKTLPLQVGMSLTANIKLRKVSYLQLLLGTFQDKADSLRAL